LVAYSGTYLARARRFAAAGARGSTWTLLGIVTIHGAANRLMPLRTGELSYPLMAKRVGAAPIGEGLVQILMLRIVDLLTVAALFLVALVLALAFGVADLGESTTVFVVAAALLAVVSGAALSRLGAVLRAFVRLARRLFARGDEGEGTRIAHALDRAEEAAAVVADLTLARRLRIVFWSVACWSAYFVTFHLILLALGVDLPLLRTVLGSSAAIVGSTVPISGLGTFGALEGGWTAGFVAVGLEPSTAASTAIVMSGLTLLFAVLLAAVGWVALGARAVSAEEGSDGSRR
jgi:uncharacterized protein (TIRG00374 family)